jgi:hypothetical protein
VTAAGVGSNNAKHVSYSRIAKSAADGRPPNRKQLCCRSKAADDARQLVSGEPGSIFGFEMGLFW